MNPITLDRPAMRAAVIAPRPSIRFGGMEDVFGPIPPVTPEVLEVVRRFLEEMASQPTLSDNQLRSKVTFLIGPMCRPIQYSRQHTALQQIAADKKQYPDLAPVAQRALVLYSDRVEGDGKGRRPSFG